MEICSHNRCHIAMIFCCAFGLYSSSNVFSLKTTFRKLALLPCHPPSPLFDLMTEAEPASETLFLKKEHWTMD
jgi:hypothetical protein